MKCLLKNSKVQTWLAQSADINPYLGGKYELFWDIGNKETNSTINCKITAIDHLTKSKIARQPKLPCLKSLTFRGHLKARVPVISL